MITENNYWEYLILHSRRKLTIPYIIGSKKIMLRCLKYDSVYDLFEKITNSNTDKVFSFYFCTDIGEYAVRSDFPGYAMKGIEVKNPINNKTTIVLSKTPSFSNLLNNALTASSNHKIFSLFFPS